MHKRLFVLTIAAVLMASACGTSTTSSSPAATGGAPSATPAASEGSAAPAAPELTGSKYAPEPAPSQGDTLVIAEWQVPGNINPYYAQANTDIEAGTPALLGLLDTSYDLKYVPDLATEVPLVSNGGVVVNGTGMDVTWKLREGGKWSDGEAITCDDLTATWKWNMDPDNVGLAGGTIGWEDISGIDATNPTTCVMHFKNVYEGYLGLVAPLLPAHYLAKVPAKDSPTKLYPLTNLASGVYSGPFMPVKFAAGSQITYDANPNYGTVSGGKTPGFKHLIFKYYPDNPDGMIAGFAQGEYDLAMNLNHSDIPKLTGMDKVLTEDTFTYEQLSFNNKRLLEKTGSEADVQAVKEAVGLAIDKSQITGQILGGTVDPIGTNNISPLAWYFKQEPDSKHDPEAAKAKLDAAGWVPGADGVREKNGKKLAFDFCTTTRPYRIDSLTAFASQLAPIGIKVNPMPVSADIIFGSWTGQGIQADTPCNLIHGNFDAAMYAFVSPLDPLGGYNVYTCQGIPDAAPHNGQNSNRLCNKELDAAWNAVKSNVDFSKVRDAMYTVQDLYSKLAPEYPLFYWKNAYLVSPKLHNVTGNPTTSSVLWNVEDWWLDQ
ncbi:MAG: peptide/nickel transport system substrate-binding protein [Chloroflexota bacterium]|jgi:peptide/nickel transport system substrate-binding protein|nr:peptide/nickel transport system substrate-binding protein [Chloroflexota bacterium]